MSSLRSRWLIMGLTAPAGALSLVGTWPAYACKPEGEEAEWSIRLIQVEQLAEGDSGVGMDSADTSTELETASWESYTGIRLRDPYTGYMFSSDGAAGLNFAVIVP